MLFRRKEREMIHITIAGIGKFGMEVCQHFHTRFMECHEKIDKGLLKVVTNRNELSVICNIELADLVGEYSDRLIPWNDLEIEREERTRDVLITVGEPQDLSFKMFHSTAIGLLGKPECKRIAFIKNNEGEIENGLLSQQLDHVITCDGIQSAVGMILLLLRLCYIQDFDMCTLDRDEFRYLFGGCTGKIIMSYKERLALMRTYTECDGFTYAEDICKMVEGITKNMRESIDITKKYIAFIYTEGLWSLDLLGTIMERFRSSIGRIQVVDEKLAFSKTIEYDGRIRNSCMILLMETDN